MKIRIMIVTITLAAIPFLASAVAQHPDHSPQATNEQSLDVSMMASHAMGQGMMNLIGQVKNDLAALANENAPAILREKLMHDQSLLERIEAHMQSMHRTMDSMMSEHSTMSRGMMSREMSNCPSAGKQPQK